MRVLYGFFVGLALSLGCEAETRSPRDIPVESFAQIPSYRGMKISPDGTHIAYRATLQGRSFILVHPVTDASRPVAIPPFSENEILWFDWANDDYLAVSYSHRGIRTSINGQAIFTAKDLEETRFLGFRRDGANLDDPVVLARPIKLRGTGTRFRRSGSPPMRQDYVVDWLRDDPDHFLLAVDGDFDGNTELRRVKVKNGRFKVIKDDVRGIQNWVTDQEGEPRFAYGTETGESVGIYFKPGGGSIGVSDADWFQRGMRVLAFEKDPRIGIAVGRLSSDSDLQSVVRMEVESGKILEVLYEHPDFDAAGFMVDSKTQEFIGVRSPGEKAGYRYFDKSWQVLRQSVDKALPKTDNYFVSMSPDRKYLVILAQSDVESGLYYLWNRNAKSLKMISALYRDLHPTLMSPMQHIQYKARDGLEISGFLTVPKGVEPQDLPLVVIPHGGPFARDGWGFDFLVQMMASRGFAVLQPNFRGSVLQGKAFAEAGKKQWGGKMQDDITDGVRHLIDRGIADPKRVCIVGWSYGGYAALMGAVKTPDLYRCAASINGVSSLRTLAARFNRSLEYRRFIREFIGLEGASLADVSPVNQAESIRIPILLVHAEDDVRVRVRHADKMAAKLKDLGKPYVYERIEWGGGHSLTAEQGRLRMMTALEAFLLQHLGPGPVAQIEMPSQGGS